MKFLVEFGPGFEGLIIGKGGLLEFLCLRGAGVPGNVPGFKVL